MMNFPFSKLLFLGLLTAILCRFGVNGRSADWLFETEATADVVEVHESHRNGFIRVRYSEGDGTVREEKLWWSGKITVPEGGKIPVWYAPASAREAKTGRYAIPFGLALAIDAFYAVPLLGVLLYFRHRFPNGLGEEFRLARDFVRLSKQVMNDSRARD
jgi:hypothetical protein